MPNIQVNPTYTVNVGPQARVGGVAIAGADTGFTADEFRKKAKLKNGKVTRDTVSNALTRIRSQYQKRDRLEATATLEKQTYNAQRKQVDYNFNANQGPLVKVVVEGAKLSKGPVEAAGADLSGGDDRQRPAERGDVQHAGFSLSAGLLRRDGLGKGGGRGDGLGERGVRGGEGGQAQGGIGDDCGQPLLRYRPAEGADAGAEGGRLSAQWPLLAGVDEGGRGGDPGAIPREWVQSGDDYSFGEGHGYVEVTEGS